MTTHGYETDTDNFAYIIEARRRREQERWERFVDALFAYRRAKAAAILLSLWAATALVLVALAVAGVIK